MAMETGSKEMRRGLLLMDGVTDSTSEVRLTTDQQRIATEQVVQTMVSVSTATKQTASTAQQIAGASNQIADLASQLERASRTFQTTATEPAAAGRPAPRAPLGDRRPAPGPPRTNGAANGAPAPAREGAPNLG
jgi:hypothetical protein